QDSLAVTFDPRVIVDGFFSVLLPRKMIGGSGCLDLKPQDTVAMACYGFSITLKLVMGLSSLSVKRRHPDQATFSLTTLNTTTLTPFCSITFWVLSWSLSAGRAVSCDRGWVAEECVPGNDGCYRCQTYHGASSQ